MVRISPSQGEDASSSLVGNSITGDNFLSKDLVFCVTCKFLEATSYGFFCTHTEKFNITPIRREKYYDDAVVKNKNNDCADFQQKWR